MTDNHIQHVRAATCDRPGQVIVYWLGGSGFVVKLATGEILCIDPYLSDCVERIAGFRRLSAPPVAAHELDCDYLLVTHDHPDHLDVDSFAALVRTNPGLRVVAGTSCRDFLAGTNQACRLVAPGDVVEGAHFTLHAVPADHGDLCPEALGFVVAIADRKIYFTGDTCFNERLLQPVVAQRPEIVVPCINGAFGNLTEIEAAELVRRCRAEIAIPAHFWLFAEHGGDPGRFRQCLASAAPDTKLILLTPGRGMVI